MSDLIKNILIPVDFRGRTEAAISQAIELECAGGLTIHLLHVIKSGKTWRSVGNPDQPDLLESGNYAGKEETAKIQQWIQVIQASTPNIRFKICIMTGNVHDNIMVAARRIDPQLIILEKTNNSKGVQFFNSEYPDRLAKSTNLPVLTVLRGSASIKIKTIVAPVGSFIPKRKIELIAVFAQKYRAKIHIVALQNYPPAENAGKNAILDTYRILRTGLTNQIEYHLLKGNNLPKETLKYAENVKADMLFVNPGCETIVSKFTGKHITSMLPPNSKLKIMTVKPYHIK